MLVDIVLSNCYMVSTNPTQTIIKNAYCLVALICVCNGTANYRIAYKLGYACLFESTGFRTVSEQATTHKFIRRFAAAFLMPEEAIKGCVAYHF